MHEPLPDFNATWAADIAACRALLCEGSRSFYAASFFLPRRVREPAIALYAFCRLADDAIDTEEAAPNASQKLADRLERAYAGRPLPIAADRALADVVARFAIPAAIPHGLLEGLAWDAAGRRYETLSDLTAYAARVAGTVGAMMALLMGQRDPAIVAYACDLGIAMQFTNIARDVGEDARAGRLYLPQQWLREAGIDPETWLAQPDFTPAIGAIIGRLLEAADRFYTRSEAGIANLPRDCQPGIRAARLLYAEIGRAVERNGRDSVSQRAFVPGRRKAQLLVQAVTTSLSRRSYEVAASWLEETRFIVDAVKAAPRPHRPTAARRPQRDVPRAVWLIELFERLERREREAGLARTSRY